MIRKWDADGTIQGWEANVDWGAHHMNAGRDAEERGAKQAKLTDLVDWSFVGRCVPDQSVDIGSGNDVAARRLKHQELKQKLVTHYRLWRQKQ